MMEFIAHRINTIDELQKLPHEFGVELDLRDEGERLIIQHDPFKSGEDFNEYCRNYKHGTIICNIKSERIEERVLATLKENNITRYFFLDSSFPMIYTLSQKGERNIALRFSEYEGLDTVLAMKGKADWVWVDSFKELPINPENYKQIKGAGFKLCLVSPELQGRDGDIEPVRAYLTENNIVFDAICTKAHNIERWKN